jgi:membrane protease YdiL (CAAX protease family)
MEQKFLVFAAVIFALAFVLPTADYLSWAAKGFVLLFVMPAAFVLAYRKKLSGFGFAFGNIRISLIFTIGFILVSIPVLIYYSGSPDFRLYYSNQAAGFDFLSAGLLLFLNFLGIEFFFRGFLIKLLQERFGFMHAVLLQSFLYMIVHIGKPLPELVLSFFAGIIFGYIALKAKSILPSLASHYSLAVIFSLLMT